MYDVVCVGNVAIDEYYRVDRIPGVDEKVHAKYLGKVLGGTTCNTARALSNLGANGLFISRLGKDEGGAFVERKFREINLPARTVWMEDSGTYVTLVMVADNGEKAILLLTPPSPKADTLDNLPVEETRVVFSTGDQPDLKYIERFTAPIVVSLERATVELNPAIVEWVFRHVHTLILDTRGFEAVFHREISPEALKEVMQAPSFAMENIVVTLGSKGSIACTRSSGGVVFSGAYPVRPVDTTGAGDIFCAAFMYGFFKNGLSLKQSLNFGNAIAAASCEDLGPELTQGAIQKAHEFLAANGNV